MNPWTLENILLKPLPPRTTMPTKIMFLICAQLQSGKDTFGRVLAKATNGILCGFADPVKEVAIAMLGMPPVIAYGSETERRAWKRYGKDAREWLQWIGSEMGREMVNQDVWLNRLLERVDSTAAESVVVTDVRFKNELEGLQDLAKARKESGVSSIEFRFVKIRLKRPGYENNLDHASESEQKTIPDDFFDEVVTNDGTARDLESKARVVAKKYLAG